MSHSPSMKRNRELAAIANAVSVEPTAADAAHLYGRVLQRMAARMNGFYFRGFLEPLRALRLVDNQLTLVAQNAFHRDWIRDHYASELAKEAGSLANATITVGVLAEDDDIARLPRIEAAPRMAAAPAPVLPVMPEMPELPMPALPVQASLLPAPAKAPARPRAAMARARSAQAEARAEPKAPVLPEPIRFEPVRSDALQSEALRVEPLRSESRRLEPVPADRVVSLRPRIESRAAKGSERVNARYTFDTFVAGACNRIALGAAMAVAEAPAQRYSPLFLFGPTGLGKTHLLHAIANDIRARHPHLRVMYVSAEQWVNEYIHDIREKKFDEFRRRYREGCDVLLLDDVQFLAGKESSQDEFFHTFNSLYENHKQIVVTSDRYPHEIQGLEERLKTRLQWGLVADLKAPDLAMRLDLLQDKAQAHGVDLPLDVANYLATQCAQSVRELEGALLRLQAFASITREPLSLAQAREHLSPMLASQAAPVTLARVTEVVATYYGLKPVDVRGPSRQRQIARARQVSMFLIRTHLKASLPEIGRFFGGRDHTTALSSIRKIDGLTKTDVSMQAVVARLSQSLFAG